MKKDVNNLPKNMILMRHGGIEHLVKLQLNLVRKPIFMNEMKEYVHFILEAFEIEVVELLFPEVFDEIAWELGTESLDLELQEIQKEIFDKDSAEKVISEAYNSQ